eukprot:CAMPEP_0116147320 /NCGR_PEP_ID=MMETSP0329-20121206/17690_1 /TAXON_ID=697910 /ORGANISM="Pseudo-nitzschia arenysensis, Strain B593" /LENGTH=705 /DNA_ID=CAMNT_0003643237 /DNA_START=150 /DNA_END=2267 /DNA_ORIENTATION=+
MSSGFTLPPVIRRFGRCGEWEQKHIPSSGNSVSTESPPGYGDKARGHYGGATNTDRVKSFVNGIVSPFAACLQPADAACGPGCTSDKVFDKQPSVVTPHMDRVVPYRDSRAEHDQDDYYIRRHPHYHPRHHRSPTNYHRHPQSKPVASPPTYRRDPAAANEAESEAAKEKKRSTDIAKPRSNDILCGRGGSSNRHLGNIHFRELVAANKQIYVGLTKKQKMLVARKIVDAIHNTGGRFLAKDLDTGMFYDIGLPRSLEKTSQALREKHSNEMPAQQQQQQPEDEGIETSVESHNSVVKNSKDNGSSDGSKAASEETSPDATPSKSTSSSKNKVTTEAPDLVIPPHLMSKFGPKGAGAPEEDWENQHPHSMSPRSYHSDPSYDNHRSPYPPSPYSGSPPKHSRNGYPPPPPAPPGHPPPAGHPHHRHSRYPTSPVPSNGQYPPPHYYYPHGHHPQTPPYGSRGPPPDDRYAYNREAYNAEYYKRTPPYHGYPRHHGRPAPHLSPPPPPRGPPPPQRGGPPPQPRAGYGSPPALPSFRPSPHSYYRHGSGEPETSSSSGPSRVIYRNSNSGYVRGNTELSPGRQRDFKRPRNDVERSNDVSLSSAVKNSLSLDDRVVGKEREKLKQQKRNFSTGSTGSRSSSSSPLADIVSPSSMLQTKSSSRGSALIEIERRSPSERKEDYSALSGLAALSTAAFLKLDEDDDVKQ